MSKDQPKVICQVLLPVPFDFGFSYFVSSTYLGGLERIKNNEVVFSEKGLDRSPNLSFLFDKNRLCLHSFKIEIADFFGKELVIESKKPDFIF